MLVGGYADRVRMGLSFNGPFLDLTFPCAQRRYTVVHPHSLDQDGPTMTWNLLGKRYSFQVAMEQQATPQSIPTTDAYYSDIGSFQIDRERYEYIHMIPVGMFTSWISK